MGAGSGGGGAFVTDEQLSRDEAVRVIRRLWRMMRPWRREMVIAGLLVAGQTGTLLAGPTLVRHGIDAGLLHGDVGALNLSAGLYLGCAFLALVFGRVVVWRISNIGETFLRDLRSRVFRHLMGLGLDFFEREKTGVLVARMTSDLDALQELIQYGLTSL